MTNHRWAIERAASRWICIALIVGGAFSAPAQTNGATVKPPDNAVRIDRVVAVVNRQPILESDLLDEMQFSVLDPSTK